MDKNMDVSGMRSNTTDGTLHEPSRFLISAQATHGIEINQEMEENLVKAMYNERKTLV